MIKPLTKTKDGEVYTRPPNIQRALERALELDQSVLLERAKIREPTAEGHIPAECLVYIIRRAMESDDSRALNALVPILLDRCRSVLQFRLDESMKDEILNRFALRLANDGQGRNPDALDFYELKFNSAFKALTIDVLRTERKHTKSRVDITNLTSDDDPSGCEWLDRQLASLRDNPAAVSALIIEDIISILSADEQKAVILHYVMGYEIESKAPANITVATQCGVSGRTVQNWLRRAAAKLAKSMEHIS